MSEVLRKTLPLSSGRISKIETNGSKMESQVELRRKRRKRRNPRWIPRWSSDGCQGIQDGIPDGTQLEAKEANEAKIDSQDRNQVISRSNPSNPRGNPRHIKKTGHNWSVFKIYRELNDYSATTSNEKVPFTFL